MVVTRFEISRHPWSVLGRPHADPAGFAADLAARPEFAEYRATLQALAESADEGSIREGLLQLAQTLDRRPDTGLAPTVYAFLSRESGDAAISVRASEALELSSGHGPVLQHAEHLGRSLAAHATDLAPLLGMTAASWAFRAVRLGTLSRLAATPRVSRLANLIGATTYANLAGFGAEVVSFSAASRLGNMLLGRRQDWSRAALGHELASGAIFLGTLKVFSFLSTGLSTRLAARGRTSEAALLSPLANYSGIVTSHYLEQAAGLRPAGASLSSVLCESLATLLQVHAAGRFNHALLGEHFASSEAALDETGQRLSRLSSIRIPRLDVSGLAAGLRAAALFPLWMMMGAGGIGGGGATRRPAGRYRAPLATNPAETPSTARRIRLALDQIPDLQRWAFEDIAFFMVELFSRKQGLPLEVWLGRSLRNAPAELLEFWSEYYFDPDLAGRETFDSLSWLRQHHLSQGVARARRLANHEDAAIRIESIATLEHFLRRESIPDLLEKLADPSLEVRIEASELLMRHGINAALPGDRLRIAEETQGQDTGIENLAKMIREDYPLPDVTMPSGFFSQLKPSAKTETVPSSASDWQSRMVDPYRSRKERQAAIERLGGILPRSEFIVALRASLGEAKLGTASPLLETLDQIDPEWDHELRSSGAEIFTELAKQWQQRFPGLKFSETITPALRALGALPKSSAGSAAGLAGIGVSFGSWLFAEQAHASFGAPGADGSVLPWLMLGGAAAIFSVRLAESLGGSGPAMPPAPRPLLGRFENAYDIEESFPVAKPAPGEVLPVGRSTGTRAGIFPTELRNIARHHLEIREHEGRVEVRSPNRARVVRINGYNLTFNDWYLLNDGDIVEFVGEPRADVLVWQDDPNHEGQLIQAPLRLGERSYRSATGADQAAMFRFRRAAPVRESAPPPAAAPLGNWFGGIVSSLRSLLQSESERPPAASRDSSIPEAVPETPAPPTAAIDMNALSRDILKFSDQLRGVINLFEAGLGAPGSFQPSTEALHALVVAHRNFCGTAERIQRVPGPEGLKVSTLSMIKVPAWDGVLLQRLQYYERALLSLPEAERFSPHSEGARSEIAKIRDRLNRLFEIVGRYRVYYSGAAEQEIFDAIERAYHGLRQPKRRPAERVRSPTRTLDAEVRNRERELWIQDFLVGEPPSRAIINMRIIMGDIAEVRGEAVVGSFYRALEQGVVENTYRIVRAHYDLESGEIVAFNDGSRAVTRALRALERQGRRVAELALHVDTIRSGRILDVTGIDPETRESIRNPLTWLRGLQVLPDTDSDPPPPPEPEVPEASTVVPASPHVEWEDRTARSYPARRYLRAFTEPNQGGEAWQLGLSPDLASTVSEGLREVVAITPIPGSEPARVLITLQGFDVERLTGPGRTDFDAQSASLQLWVASSDIAHLQVGDLVSVRPQA